MRRLGGVFILLFGAASAFANVETSVDTRIDATDKLTAALKAELVQRYPATKIEIAGAIRWTSGGLPTQPQWVSLLSEDTHGGVFFQVKENEQDNQVRQGVARFSAWTPAYIAIRRIQPGEKLSPDLFMAQDIDVASGLPHEYRGVILSKETALTSLEARQTILEGQFLTTTAVQRMPDIRRGDQVRLLLNSGGLVLSAPGVAQEPGYLGGQVRVLSGANKREILGKLQAGGVVEVNL